MFYLPPIRIFQQLREIIDTPNSLKPPVTIIKKSTVIVLIHLGKDQKPYLKIFLESFFHQFFLRKNPKFINPTYIRAFLSTSDNHIILNKKKKLKPTRVLHRNLSVYPIQLLSSTKERRTQINTGKKEKKKSQRGGKRMDR